MMIKNRAKHLLLFIPFFPLFCNVLSAKEIVDMYGHKVMVPDKIHRIYSFNISVSYLVYALAPEMIVGLNNTLRDYQKPFFPKSYQDLPVLGSLDSLALNLELVIAQKPDILLVWGGEGAYTTKVAGILGNLKIPVVAVNTDGLSRYKDALQFMGKLLDRQKRANDLTNYIDRTFKEVTDIVSRIPVEKRISVYNIRQESGLLTACEGSLHSELIPIAGGINPVKCGSGQFGVETINMERVLLMNPDAIVTLDTSFAKNVYANKVWQDIKAVKTKRVYLTPKEPINWFDMPPSIMGILGMQWLTQCLYSEYYRKDIVKEAQYFIKLFFKMDLTNNQIRTIIEGRNI